MRQRNIARRIRDIVLPVPAAPSNLSLPNKVLVTNSFWDFDKHGSQEWYDIIPCIPALWQSSKDVTCIAVTIPVFKSCFFEGTHICFASVCRFFTFIIFFKKKNDINKGKYIGVGGHIELNESKEQALIREVKEETGLTLNSAKLCAVEEYTPISGEDRHVIFLYKSNDFSGVVREHIENEDRVFWIDRSKLFETFEIVKNKYKNLLDQLAKNIISNIK